MTLFAINPFRIRMIIGYNPPIRKKWGIIKYGNGFTLRLNKLAWHFTKLKPVNYSK